MQRTQVYFPEEILEALRREAFLKETSLADVIRRKVIAQLPKKKREKKFSGGEFLLSLANEAEKLGFVGPKDLSKNIDEYLYGEKRIK